LSPGPVGRIVAAQHRPISADLFLGFALPAANEEGVDSFGALESRIAQEQDDLLATIQLVSDNERLSLHLFDALVDRLVAGLFLEMRYRHLTGELSDNDLAEEMMELTTQCRVVGLEPPV
jgi:hypothetical protein